MQASRITTTDLSAPTPDMAWLIAQHDRDLAALDRAADKIAELEGRCDRYAADQASLILSSKRAERAT